MNKRTLWIVATRICNLDCMYCYQGSHKWTWQQDKNLKKFITDDVLKEALEWSLRWAPNEFRIQWYGGEPLLAFDMMKKWVPTYAEAFAEAGINLTQGVTTNGILLNQEVRDFFDEHSIDVHLSIDGPKVIHDQQRVNATGEGSWEKIELKEILEWRPRVSTVWQLDPRIKFAPEHLDAVINYGLKVVNFNINWLQNWSTEALDNLENFMMYVAQQATKGIISTNYEVKMEKALFQKRLMTPCGTGENMLALTPEGWLYPSQEMAFSCLEPERAPDTNNYYRVGNVFKDPVIDEKHLNEVKQIKIDDLIPCSIFSCDECIARRVCVGGCHCRYVGQNQKDASYRFDIPEAFCSTMIASLQGFLIGAIIEGWFMKFKKEKEKKHKPIGVKDVYDEIIKLSTKMDNLNKRVS